MVSRFVLVVLLALPSPAGATERILGLVEVPALFVNADQGQKPKGPVPLFVEPSQNAEVAAIVRDWQQLEYREHDGEMASAVVYGQHFAQGSGTWYRLRSSQGGKQVSGWLSPGDAGTFRRVLEIVRSGLTYLTNDWDKRLYEQPDPTSRFKLLEHLGNHPDVSVASAWGSPEDPWLLIVIRDGNICSGGTRIIATGWVPAYSASGAVAVWHYSRGC